MSEDTYKYEEFLMKGIQRIQERHYQELKWWFDQLENLRNMRIPPIQLHYKHTKKWIEMNTPKEQEDESIDSDQT